MSTSLYAPDFLEIFNRYRDTGGSLQAFASPADCMQVTLAPLEAQILGR